MSYIDLKEEFEDKIMTLDELIWDGRVSKRKIERWLSNFKNDKEKIHALFLLSHFVYFDSIQVRNLLVSLYRDVYKYKKIEAIRRTLNDTTDYKKINDTFNEELKRTRFLGIGNPSESGTHMLYYFRQENRLSKKLFANVHDVFNRKITIGKNKLKYKDINHYVFIDDFCGSGSQAKNYSNNIVNEIKQSNPKVKVDYLMLVATEKGLNEVKSTNFDNVESVFVLDNTFKVFNSKSRYFRLRKKGIEKDFTENMCSTYGEKLMKYFWKREGVSPVNIPKLAKSSRLGFSNCQLLIGFHHNVPDNTLPIIWYDEIDTPWNPIFKRYNKKYSL